MLEKPDLPDERLSACLKDDFGLSVEALSFLPLGADVDTAVYRAQADDAACYFVKLRRGAFEPSTVLVPQLLGSRGVPAVIPPIATTSGALWSRLDAFTVLVNPFVAGRDGYERELTKRQWMSLGQLLRGLHELGAGEVLGRLPRERYSPRHRERVRGFLSHAETDEPLDIVAAQVKELLCDRREVVLELLERADELAASLEARKLPHVVCHGDIHAGNVLVGDNGSLYVVDWDTLLLAPRERDLMAIGMGGVWPAGTAFLPRLRTY